MARGSFLIVFLFVLCLLLFSVFQISAIRYPISPSEPKTPSVKGYKEAESKKASNKTDQTPNNDFKTEIRVKVTLGSADELMGFIKTPEKVKFEHYKNGLIFKKTIHTKNISSIEIKSFQKKLIWKKKGKKNFRYFYEFKPFKIRILTKDKNEFFLDHLFKFLHKFKIHTSDGVTTLYAFFADEFSEDKGWSEVESRESSYHDTKPHPKSIKKVTFFNVKDEE